MSDEKKPLNLDELFGQDRPVKLVWQGRDYSMLRSEAFGARELMKLGRLQVRMNELKNNAEATDSAVEELERTVDEILWLLCPELPLGEIPFSLKMTAIEFYANEMKKKAIRLAIRSIGVPLSAN